MEWRLLCVFDNNSNDFEYALAGGRFVIKDMKIGGIEVIKSQGKHIGDVSITDDFTYNTVQTTLPEDYVLYFFSDGFPDQFGGEKNKKLTIKKFLSLINTVSNLPISEQKEMLQDSFIEWIGDLPQTDDITVIGVKGKR